MKLAPSTVARLALAGAIASGVAWPGSPLAARVAERAPAAPPHVLAVRLTGMVSPVMDDILGQAIARAAARGDRALLVELDTPGGLESSMRDMVQRELASPVPVIVWVTPGGAHAASAGVFVTMAADVAAMSPGTNIGAATPISLQGPMDSTLARKATNDAAAFARTVAAQRGRSVAWAERAVREAVAASDREAVELGIVDFIASSQADLLEKSDGRTMRRGADSSAIHVRGASVERMEPSFRQRVLGHLVDPNIAYLLLMLGFYGLLFELQNPGAILPGVAGAIFLVLAFLALSALPVNVAGLALLVLGVGFLLAEIKVHSHGVLAVGGALALGVGGLILFDDQAVRVAWPLVLAVTAVTVAFFLVVIGFAVRGRRGRRVTGAPAMLGRRALVVEGLLPRGRVRLDGEVWNAEAQGFVEVGAEVVVIGVEGLTLRVRPAAREA
ncbi:MAG TPA: nodulation protein NfeD [Candidatus Eisenbacteria bacterium]